MTQYDAFEEKFAAALQSDEMPAADFTARVMAQVAKTPQVKAGTSQRGWKIALTAAACAAVVAIAVPVVFLGTMRAGSAAPEAADCAAEAPAAMEPACEEEAADGRVTNGFSITADSAEENGIAAGGTVASQKASDPTGVFPIADEVLCRQVREVLSEMGIESDSNTYFLTAEQAATLHEAMPELVLPEGDFTLVLEG